MLSNKTRQFSLLWVFQLTAVVAVTTVLFNFLMSLEGGVETTLFAVALTLSSFAIDFGWRQLEKIGVRIERMGLMIAIVLFGWLGFRMFLHA